MHDRGINRLQTNAATFWLLLMIGAALVMGPAVATSAQDDPADAPGKTPEQIEAEAKLRFVEIMAEEDRTVGFLEKTIRHGKADRAYQVFVPLDYDARRDEPYPVVLYLHGDSERGIYGQRPRKAGLPARIEADHGRFDWIVVIPQALPGPRWSDEQLQLAKATLERTLHDYHTDVGRVYLGGIDEGGAAAMRLAAMLPRQFAAMVVTTGYDRDVLPAVRHVPTWYWYGRDDPHTHLWHARHLVSEFARAGAVELRYSEIDKADANVWKQAFGDEKVFDWLAEHRVQNLGRQAALAPRLDAPRWHNPPLHVQFRLDQKGRPQFAVPELEGTLARLKFDLRSGRVAAALDRLDDMLEHSRLDDEERDQAQALREKIVAYRDKLIAAGKAFEKAKDYHNAIRALEAVKDQFAGTEESEKAAETLAQWKRDTQVVNELKAWDLYDRAEQARRAGRDRDAAQAYQLIIDRYAETEAADDAKRRYDTLKAEGRI